MNDKVMKGLKFLVPAATFGLGLLSTWLSNKELDAKIAEKSAEAVANLINKEV
jgi:hypothetical protein